MLCFSAAGLCQVHAIPIRCVMLCQARESASICFHDGETAVTADSSTCITAHKSRMFTIYFCIAGRSVRRGLWAAAGSREDDALLLQRPRHRQRHRLASKVGHSSCLCNDAIASQDAPSHRAVFCWSPLMLTSTTGYSPVGIDSRNGMALNLPLLLDKPARSL